MYSVTHFVDVSDGQAGMLIPVFASSSTNLPYVQQMDEYFQVTEMLPFLEFENYPLVVCNASRSTEVGDRGLVAFRSTDNSIVCGTVAETLNFLDRSRETIKASPHLYSQLLRIEGVERGFIYEAWKAVAQATFEREDQRQFWISSELALFEAQQHLWEDIGSSSRADDRSRIAFGLSGALNSYSSEYLIRWLANRKNFSCADWAKIWHYVNERDPFESRLFEVALQWLYFTQAEGLDLSEARSIVFAILQLSRFAKGGLADLGGFLSDELINDLPTLYGFLRPAKLFENLLSFLGSHGEPEDVLSIAKYILSELPRDPYVLSSLVSALRLLRTRVGESEALQADLDQLSTTVSVEIDRNS
jgi:hypothetical protein